VNVKQQTASVSPFPLCSQSTENKPWFDQNNNNKKRKKKRKREREEKTSGKKSEQVGEGFFFDIRHRNGGKAASRR